MESKPGLAGKGNNMTFFCSLLLCLALNRRIKLAPLFYMRCYTFRMVPVATCQAVDVGEAVICDLK